MAQRPAKAFGNSARFWLTLQMQHDIWHAERKAKVAVKRLQWKNADAA
jgi:plasmid maintenance system antidote protein VapI